jgi:hypothetical protein
MAYGHRVWLEAIISLIVYYNKAFASATALLRLICLSAEPVAFLF